MKILSIDELKNILSYTDIYDKMRVRVTNLIFSKIISKGIVIKYLILKTYKIGFFDGYCTNSTKDTINLDESIQKINNISDYISKI